MRDGHKLQAGKKTSGDGLYPEKRKRNGTGLVCIRGKGVVY